MEIEFTGFRKITLGGQATAMAAIVAAFVALFVLGLIGRSFTRFNESGAPLVMGWAEWNVLRAERAYRDELAALHGETDLLAETLAGRPEPVRAHLELERLENRFRDGEAALARQRQAIIAAAAAVSDWAGGVIPLDEAQAALANAVETLRSIETPASQQPPQPASASRIFLPLVQK